ncbi:hypothetical protein QBC42DRAFT_273029, partial [Cladorrhinum samala]
MASLQIPARAVARQSSPASPLLLSLSRRAFTTSPQSSYKQPRIPNSSIPIPSVTAPHPEIPPYPLGPRQVYHQSNTGLYGSASIRFGNNVSKKNEIKTRRSWRPNVHHKRLWSRSLGVFVRTRVTTRVLRTIDKVGGLDEYLLGIKPRRIADLGPWGWKLRWRIMQTPSVRARFRAESKDLGLEVGSDGQVQKITLPDGTVVSFEEAEAYAKEIDGELLASADESGEGKVVDLVDEAELKETGFMKED